RELTEFPDRRRPRHRRLDRLPQQDPGAAGKRAHAAERPAHAADERPHGEPDRTVLVAQYPAFLAAVDFLVSLAGLCKPAARPGHAQRVKPPGLKFPVAE